jgi:hypothetical protein
VRTDPPVIAGVDELAWTGPTGDFARICASIDAPSYPSRAAGLARRQG